MASQASGLHDVNCPVPLEVLGQLHRTDPDTVLDELRHLSEDQRARLALFCYGRAHFRPLALKIAASCHAERLSQLAGVQGAVLASQCKGRTERFGLEVHMQSAGRPKAKISLGGAKRAA